MSPHRYNDASPIYKAVGLIEDRCERVITYEDPRYNEKQVVDKTPKALRDGTPPRRRSLFPPRAFFSFQYDLAAASQGREDLQEWEGEPAAAHSHLEHEFSGGQRPARSGAGRNTRTTTVMETALYVVTKA